MFLNCVMLCPPLPKISRRIEQFCIFERDFLISLVNLSVIKLYNNHSYEVRYNTVRYGTIN